MGEQHAVSAVRRRRVDEGRARSIRPSTLLLRHVRPTPNAPLGCGFRRLPLPQRHHRPRRALVSAFPLALWGYADMVELLAERGVHVDPSRVVDWVQRCTPLYKEAARPHRHRVGTPWCRIPGELRRCSLPVRTLSHYPCATQTSRAPCEPYPTLPHLFFPATRPPTLPTSPPHSYGSAQGSWDFLQDWRRVSGTLCASCAEQPPLSHL